MYPRSFRRRRRALLAACVAILSAVPAGGAAQSPRQATGSTESPPPACDHEPAHPDRCGRRPRLAYVESGALLGKSRGTLSGGFSPVVGFMEAGLLHGARTGRSRRGFGLGATAFLGAGAEDLRFAIRPRVRYRFSEGFATDVCAGPVWSVGTSAGHPIDGGYLASVSLQFGGWLTLRTDVQTRPIPPWSRTNTDTWELEQVPGGRENAVYFGVALRNRPGWTTAIVGTGMVALLVIVAGAMAGAVGAAS
jgi:hypothetical protein